MVLTKRELIQRLINGEKLKPKSYTGNCYCCYDEAHIKPFRYVSIPSLYSTPMINAWEQVEWELYEETPEWWEPKDKEAAYCISPTGKVIYDTKWNHEKDKDIINQGNMFRTEEEAEKEVKLRAAKYRVKKHIWELNGGEFIKFKSNEENWSFDSLIKKLGATAWSTRKLYPNWQYLKTKKLTEQLIDEMSEDLILIRSE